MTSTAEVGTRLQTVRERIAACARQAGREPNTIALVAVSKLQDVDKIRAAYANGQRLFGENYAQELFTKAASLSDLPLSWHFIGHLQSNKIKKIVAVADCIETVADFGHAEKIARAARELGRAPYAIYIESNVAQEAGKSGLPLADVPAFAERLKRELPDLVVEGLMAVPPASFQDETSSQVPELYRQIAEVARRTGRGRLSLGMTADMGIAIGAGSTAVRVGTGIFGARPTR